MFVLVLWHRVEIARGVGGCFLIVFTKMKIHRVDRENAAA